MFVLFTSVPRKGCPPSIADDELIVLMLLYWVALCAGAAGEHSSVSVRYLFLLP
jgi:hypothetical protein